MATVSNERHLRYILLFGEGGTLILKEILKRELTKSGNALIVLLDGHKNQIKRKTDAVSFLKVYPSDAGSPDETKWDISLLAVIILQLFKGSITKEESEEITNIRDIRNNLAHSSSFSMDENEYDDCRKELAANLIKLSNGLDRSIHDKCQNFIKQFATESISLQAVTERVKEFSRFDQVISTAIRSLTQDMTDVSKKIDVVGTTMSVESNDDRMKSLVEDSIKRFFTAALKRTGGEQQFLKVEMAVCKILEDIENCDSVELTDEERHCIMLTMRCKTCRGLLEILEYLESNLFQKRLQALSSALEGMFSGRVHVIVGIRKDSLEDIKQNLKKDMTRGTQEEHRQWEYDLQDREQIRREQSSVKDFIVTDREQKIVIPFQSLFESFERICKSSFNIPEQSQAVFLMQIDDEEMKIDNDVIASQQHLAKLIIEEAKGDITITTDTEKTTIDEGTCNSHKSPCLTQVDEDNPRPTITDDTREASSGFTDISDSMDDVTRRPTDEMKSSDEVTPDTAYVTGNSNDVTSDSADVAYCSAEVTLDPADITGASDEIISDPADGSDEVRSDLADVTVSSDEDSAYDLVDDEDVSQHLLQFGLRNIDATLKRAFKKRKTNYLNIAIIGQSGTGKSSLINALMMLRPGVKGAALVGKGDETTMECKEYKHPKYPNVYFGMSQEWRPKAFLKRRTWNVYK